MVNSFNTEEHVKRFFRPEHRALLPETTRLQLAADEPALLPAPQEDDSTKCLAECEPTCNRLAVPSFLAVNFIVQRAISGFIKRVTSFTRLARSF